MRTRYSLLAALCIATACGDDPVPTGPSSTSTSFVPGRAQIVLSAANLSVTSSGQSGFNWEASFELTLTETAGVAAEVQAATLSIRHVQTGAELFHEDALDLLGATLERHLDARGRLLWSFEGLRYRVPTTAHKAIAELRISVRSQGQSFEVHYGFGIE